MSVTTKFYFMALLFWVAISLQGAGEGLFFEGMAVVQQEEGDDPALIKDYLTHKVYTEAFLSLLKSYNLDAALFAKKYDVALQDALKTLSPQERKKHKMVMMKTLAFGLENGPDKAVTGRSELFFGKSPENPKKWVMKLKVRFDTNKMMPIYGNFASLPSSKQKTLYMTLAFDLQGAVWEDLGVENEEELRKAIIPHWITKWTGPFLIPMSTTSELDEKLSNYLSTSHLKSDEFNEAIYLQIRLEIVKENEDPFIKERQFQLGGKLAIYDLSSKKAIHFIKCKNEKKTFSFRDPAEFKNQMINLLYNYPNQDLALLPKVAKDLWAPLQTVTLTVDNYLSMEYLFTFLDLLAQKGMPLGVTANTTEYSADHILISLDYRGASKDLEHLLKTLDKTPLLNGVIVTVPQNANPFNIAFKETVHVPTP